MRVYLIDGSSYIFRAYHAMPPLSRPSDGAPTGAVHGFCQMIWKLLRDVNETEAPTHFVVIFDAARKNFRNDIYPDYKANRPPPPEDLVPQFAMIREAVEAFNLPAIEAAGFEADDLIATYARLTVEAGGEAVIVSSDKDLMQLIKPGITMLDTMKNKVIGSEEVETKFGVGPEKVIDVQALAGDSSDNVPGVPGIGVKTAALLINEYGDLDQLLASTDEIKQKKRRENLIEFADLARISRDLVTLRDDVTVETKIDDLSLQDADADKLIAFLTKMEFPALTKRVVAEFGGDLPELPAAKPAAKPNNKTSKKTAGHENEIDGGPDAVAQRASQQVSLLPLEPEGYQTLTTIEQLDAWLGEAKDQGYVAIDTETNSLDAMSADLVGVSLALAPGKACYIPLDHKPPEGLDLLAEGDVEQMDKQHALPALKALLENESVLKIGQNLKYDMLVLKQYEIDISPIDDTMLMSYALDAGRTSHGMDALSEKHLGHKPIAFKDLVGSGKAQITFDFVPVEKASKYAAEDADITLRLWQILKPRLVAEKKTTVYQTLERPLVPVLVAMEERGIHVERAVLARLSGQFAEKLIELEREIKKLAGEEDFNVASPKQLGEILFDKLDYPGGKKTKTGAWGTGAGVLEDLAGDESLSDEHRRLPQTILEWRQLAKLKSTYTDSLPEHINTKTGRIHTSYAMAATTTGRLASTDPNLQNIPVRTAEGREIRTAFVAEKGKQLISADYSQIELRLLAHIAEIPQLQQAFHDGLDIHAMTASEMFDVPVADMDAATRRRAKAINFGIIYGISAFGLANQLGISRSEAGDYIKTYFKRFPGIHDYMQFMKDEVHTKGYVETIFGRRVHYPGIKSNNRQQKSFYERAAINAPIQGSAADIIRRAMVRIEPALQEAGLTARMLLQVHDELIFEAAKKDIKKTIELTSRIMEQAAEPVVQLKVPLKVDARAARNWDEAH